MAPFRPFVLPLAAVLSLSLSTGCVSKKQYDDLARTSRDHASTDQAQIRTLTAQLQALKTDVDAATQATQARDQKLGELGTQRHNMQAALDEATAMNDQLRAELGRLGRDVDMMLKDKGTMSKALEDAKARLDELRRAQAAAETRVGIMRDIAGRFRALLDSGQMRLETRHGQLSLLLSGTMMFSGNKAELGTFGNKITEELAKAMLAAAPVGSGRRFFVISHVDDTPKTKTGAQLAMDLGARRSIQVVEKLVALGVASDQLVVATVGPFEPVTITPEVDAKLGKAVLELSLQPGPEDLVQGKPKSGT
jgi:flagellar motor protein MotB